MIFDDNPKQNNENRYDYLARHFPAGSSAQNAIYWRQLINSKGLFQKYDYGFNTNMKMYGQTTPPLYNPTLIQEEVGLFVGTDDLISSKIDCDNWYKDMINAKKLIGYYPLGHLSFVIGNDLPYLNDLLAFLDLGN